MEDEIIFTGESGGQAIEGDIFTAGSGDNENFFSDGFGTGDFTGTTGRVGESGTGSREQLENSGQKEETPFLVNEEDIISGEALENAIVNALQTVFADEDISVLADEASDPTPIPTQAISETPTPAPTYAHNIDDIYERLEKIENIQSLTYSDAVSYHQGQDIIGRVQIGIFSILIGGLVVFGFIGRIR